MILTNKFAKITTSIMKGVVVVKIYVVSFTKTGKEWKKQLKGVDYMIDHDLYRMDLKVKGLKNAIKWWWRILTNKTKHGIFIK